MVELDLRVVSLSVQVPVSLGVCLVLKCECEAKENMIQSKKSKRLNVSNKRRALCFLEIDMSILGNRINMF